MKSLSAALCLLMLSSTVLAEISVENPSVRATAPGQNNSSAYMSLTNQGDEDISLIRAERPAATYVELHTHVHDTGVMRMRKIDKIDIEGFGNTLLKPGGLHIMLIELKKPLSAGELVPMTLFFSDGEKLDIQLPVTSMQAGGMMKHGM